MVTRKITIVLNLSTKMTFRRVLSLAMVTVIFANSVQTLEGDWGYSQSDDWSDIDGSECDGPHQSPIDLLNICYNNTQITIDEDLTIYLENYNQTMSGDKIFLKNNGHSVQVGIKGGMEVQPWAPRIFGTATEEQTYQLAQVHFHWDRVNTSVEFCSVLSKFYSVLSSSIVVRVHFLRITKTGFVQSSLPLHFISFSCYKQLFPSLLLH